MKNILKIMALISLLNASVVMGKLTQSIDRTDISAGETFVLDIQITDSNDESPDLSLIPSYITIVSNSQYQHTQIINGRRSSIKGWKLKLKTLKSGKVLIPSITVGNEKTQPIELNVKKSSFAADINGEKEAIFLKAEVDQDSPYVQQQIIYTISLYRSVSTHYENLSTPIVENSIVEKLGDDAVYEKTINNKRYTVYQRKYIIFPQQSGQIEVGAVNFTADVNDSSQQSRSLFLNSTRPISVSTDPIVLNVKPKPTSASNLWLPAENVLLSERWTDNSSTSQADVIPNQLKVGEPITWTLLLTVQGLSESQLPELSIPKVDGLQMYPDTPNKEKQVNQKGILSQRVEKFAVIPSKEGSITIPAINVKWWDTKNNIEKTASLPARTFNVLPGKVVNQTGIDLTNVQPVVPPVSTIDESQIKQWQLISLVLLILWLITLGLFLNRNKQSQFTAKAEIDKESDFDKPSNLSQKEALKKAQLAIKNQTAAEVAKAIINLVNQLNNGAKNGHFHSLGAIAKKLSDPVIADKLYKIEEQRFSCKQNSQSIDLNNADLEKIISLLLNPPKNATSSAIPPLYPR